MPTATPVPDLVDRDFTAARPNQLWVADITYVRTMVGLFYLAMVLDVFSRRITGWMMADTLRTELVLAALEMAVHHRNTGRFAAAAGTDAHSNTVIHHSDYAEVRVKPRIRRDGLCRRGLLADSSA